LGLNKFEWIWAKSKSCIPKIIRSRTGMARAHPRPEADVSPLVPIGRFWHMYVTINGFSQK